MVPGKFPPRKFAAIISYWIIATQDNCHSENSHPDYYSPENSNYNSSHSDNIQPKIFPLMFVIKIIPTHHFPTDLEVKVAWSTQT